MRANRGDPNVTQIVDCAVGRVVSAKAFGLTRADNDTDLVVGKVRILDDDVALPYARGARWAFQWDKTSIGGFTSRAIRACPYRPFPRTTAEATPLTGTEEPDRHLING